MAGELAHTDMHLIAGRGSLKADLQLYRTVSDLHQASRRADFHNNTEINRLLIPSDKILEPSSYEKLAVALMLTNTEKSWCLVSTRHDNHDELNAYIGYDGAGPKESLLPNTWTSGRIYPLDQDVNLMIVDNPMPVIANTLSTALWQGNRAAIAFPEPIDSGMQYPIKPLVLGAQDYKMGGRIRLLTTLNI